MNVTGIVRNVAFYTVFACSPAIGLYLADIRDLKIYKVFNLIGIVWSIFGALTLTYLVAASESFQASALRVSAFLFAVLVVALPWGICIGAIAGLLMGYPSSRVASAIGIYLFWPGAISFFFFTDLLVNPQLRWAAPLNRRIALLGGYFFLVGMLAQLGGAIYDLIDFNG